MVSIACSFATALQESSTCDNLIPLKLTAQDVKNENECGKTYDAGQCVAYAKCRSGYRGGVGVAKNWPSDPDKSKVQKGDVIVFTNGPFGHVAYVESVEVGPNGVAKA